MSRLLRPGLVVLAAVEWVLGLWTAFFPRSFYDDYPTVDLTPPFSEHLFRDFGGATLGLAVVLGAAGHRFADLNVGCTERRGQPQRATGTDLLHDRNGPEPREPHSIRRRTTETVAISGTPSARVRRAPR